ncbi:YidH family protein [Mycolicibacterium sp. P9-22]|uniref:YidH family protein n=1 Tax=Mycolicibacterium sp. P9-22 TaxID=2024613 RepID=UPI0011ED2DC7|nr:DUF202 domain-containing protein [Mycolicibacterium sp. P9-22]KAA0114425.1 DUF202 domain-containing protein [Mycolicibacterium sp. P9-22]
MAAEEPDYRFTLANERTFLAWIRTGLALLAAGVIIGELLVTPGPHGRELALLAILCTVTAAVISVAAFRRWRRVQEAMARHQPLPRPNMLMRLTVAMLCLGSIACIALVIS